MEKGPAATLRSKMSEGDFQKLLRIDHPLLHRFIAKYVDLCAPSSVFICSDSPEDIRYIRESAIRNREEAELSIEGHTVHFDGEHDQARDKEQTKFLIPNGVDLGPELNSMDRDEGLKEIHSVLSNIMNGHELIVKFLCLGPTCSEFAIPCVQLTDSFYVAHSEDILYRQGYQEFLSPDGGGKFFKFLHSQGELEEAGLGLMVSRNIGNRRIYIDLEDEIIYSTNTQYGGNTIGLKKLAMRLAINRASKEGWLTEHMLIMGLNGQSKRRSYFTGAFPSMCGKTSTAMMDGAAVVGDDIAYLRIEDGNVRAVNVEKGLFGIIQGINSSNDPLLWNALNEPKEIIFSNVLVTDDKNVYWNSKDGVRPSVGINHSGDWFIGKKDDNGREILASHKNARFTADLKALENVDPNLDDPRGVIVNGIIYGGRDSDTCVPVEEAFDWVHGIVTKGAALESETTAAILGAEGIRMFNPMSNLDFLSIPIGRYIQNNINFGMKMQAPPHIFSVNYFLKDADGDYLNHYIDKMVWFKWMELRVHDDIDAIKTPTGLIPRYEDLRMLFKDPLKREYSEKDYCRQFTIRIPNLLDKIFRLKGIYKVRVRDTPEMVFKILEEQKLRLEVARAEYGDHVTPDMLQ